VMHKKYDVHGVQFHPESIKTPIGIKLLKNFIDH
jgi:anthranilate/para-aminobenzoate synthase component II